MKPQMPNLWFYFTRRESYKCILETLDSLYDKYMERQPTFPDKPGPPMAVDPNALTAEQAEKIVSLCNV